MNSPKDPTLWEALNKQFPDALAEKVIDEKIDKLVDAGIVLAVSILGAMVVARIMGWMV